MLDWNVFFPPGSQPRRPLQGSGFLIHGGRATGKSSLAFQAAVNCVLGGGRVLVLCQEATMDAKLPRPFVPLSALPDDALQRMEFLFVSNWTMALVELVEVSSAAAAAAGAPDMILIDDDGFALDVGDTNGAIGGRQRARGSASRSPVHHVAQCVSYLQGMADWLGGRGGKDFTYIVVTNSSAVVSGGNGSGGSSRTGGGGACGPVGLSLRSDAVRLPLAAFPLVRVHVGSGGAVEVTPLPGDRADGVRTSFSLSWDNGLRL